MLSCALPVAPLHGLHHDRPGLDLSCDRRQFRHFLQPRLREREGNHFCCTNKILLASSFSDLLPTFFKIVQPRLLLQAEVEENYRLR